MGKAGVHLIVALRNGSKLAIQKHGGESPLANFGGLDHRPLESKGFTSAPAFARLPPALQPSPGQPLNPPRDGCLQ